MLKPSLCAYNDACILVKVTITITRRGADTTSRQADEKDKGVTFKNLASFTKRIGQISWFSRNWCSNSDI